MSERTIYFWTDRAERVYAILRDRDGHWDVEWGYRAPARSDHYVQQGDHRTSLRDEGVRLLLEHARELCDDPAEVEQEVAHRSHVPAVRRKGTEAGSQGPESYPWLARQCFYAEIN